MKKWMSFVCILVILNDHYHAQCITEETFRVNLDGWGLDYSVLDYTRMVNDLYYWRLRYQERVMTIKNFPEGTNMGVVQKSVPAIFTIQYCSGPNFLPELYLQAYGDSLTDLGLNLVGSDLWEHDFQIATSENGMHAIVAELIDPDAPSTTAQKGLIEFLAIPSDPIGIYPLDALNPVDVSGMDQHATLINVVSGPDRHGDLLGAAVLNGTDAHISTPIQIDESSNSNGFSVSLWVYPTSTSSGRHQLVSLDSGGYDWSILRTGGKWFVFNGITSVDTNLTVQLNTWQHVVAIWEPGVGVHVTVNASNWTTVPTIGYDSLDSNLFIGTNPGGMNERFEGYVDDVIIYDKVIDVNEVDTIYLVDTSLINF